jgi:hypothetical protein
MAVVPRTWLVTRLDQQLPAANTFKGYRMHGLIDAVTDHGAIGDGVADDTAAWQAAIAAAEAVGGIAFGIGTFRITSPLLISSHVKVMGGGYQSDDGTGYRGVGFQPTPVAALRGTTFLPEDCDCFVAVSDKSVQFESFQISYTLTDPSPPGTNRIGIQISAPAGDRIVNMHSVIRDVTITRADISVKLTNCLEFRVDNCNTMYNRKGGIWVTGSAIPYAGDSTICNSTSWGSVAWHYLLEVHGGLRVVNNKLNVGKPNVSSGILIQPNTPVGGHVEPLIIANNSLEGQTNGITFNKGPGSDSDATQIVIGSNQIWSGRHAIRANADTTGGPMWIRGMTVTGNVLCVNGGDGCENIHLDGVGDTAIVGNLFATAGQGASTAIVKGANTTNIKATGNVATGSPGSVVTLVEP